MDGPIRIYLVGAHSTGKTTLARWIRDRYGLPMISEVARGVLAEMEAKLETLRTDLELVSSYQAQVFERQLQAERAQQGSFVSDRAFCNLAYAAQHSLLSPEVFSDGRLQRYMADVREGIVFYLRPHQELLAEDGVRERGDWEEVLRIDGMVKLMLEMYAIPYLPVASLPMQERARTVEGSLSLAGLQPRVPQRRYLSHVGPLQAEAPQPRGGNGLVHQLQSSEA
ncbi:MAG: ATP-binding protein [Planctomycetota bacterium]|nr:ATP-binding protein [Planctomycetota bacterium]